MSEVERGGEAPAMTQQEALEWLDTAITEFFGATDECARHIAAQHGHERGEDEPNMTLETSARLNTFMVQLMEIAQHGQAVIQQGAAPEAPELEPEAVPGG